MDLPGLSKMLEITSPQSLRTRSFIVANDALSTVRAGEAKNPRFLRIAVRPQAHKSGKRRVL